MAKNKEQLVEPIEEAIVIVEEVKAEPRESFVERKLKVINAMQKPAKARRLANRLLRKARN